MLWELTFLRVLSRLELWLLQGYGVYFGWLTDSGPAADVLTSYSRPGKECASGPMPAPNPVLLRPEWFHPDGQQIHLAPEYLCNDQ